MKHKTYRIKDTTFSEEKKHTITGGFLSTEKLKSMCKSADVSEGVPITALLGKREYVFSEVSCVSDEDGYKKILLKMDGEPIGGMVEVKEK